MPWRQCGLGLSCDVREWIWAGSLNCYISCRMLCISTLPIGAVRLGQVENTLKVHAEVFATVDWLITKQCLRCGVISLIALNGFWKQCERIYLMFPVTPYSAFGIPHCADELKNWWCTCLRKYPSSVTVERVIALKFCSLSKWPWNRLM